MKLIELTCRTNAIRYTKILLEFFHNSRPIRRIQQKMYKKIQRLDEVLNLGNLLSRQALLTITLECFLCLCETEIDSYCAWVILSFHLIGRKKN